jgi:hypothetical protein
LLDSISIQDSENPLIRINQSFQQQQQQQQQQNLPNNKSNMTNSEILDKDRLFTIKNTHFISVIFELLCIGGTASFTFNQSSSFD